MAKGFSDVSRAIVIAVGVCFLVAVLLPDHIIPSLDGNLRNDIVSLRHRGRLVHKSAASAIHEDISVVSTSNGDSLTGARIIPDVISKLSEDEDYLTDFILTYSKNTSITVSNGVVIPPSAASYEPSVLISKHKDCYTLLLTDPDAYSPDTPSKTSTLLWLVTNIYEGRFDQKYVVLDYQQPLPDVGTHRYVFTLWRQAHSLPIFPPTSMPRTNFNLKSFVKEYNLGEPVGVKFFYSHRG